MFKVLCSHFRYRRFLPWQVIRLYFMVRVLPLTHMIVYVVLYASHCVKAFEDRLLFYLADFVYRALVNLVGISCLWVMRSGLYVPRMVKVPHLPWTRRQLSLHFRPVAPRSVSLCRGQGSRGWCLPVVRYRRCLLRQRTSGRWQTLRPVGVH